MSLRETFDASVRAAESITDADAALVQAGRTLAERIDAAQGTDEATKVMWLMPHLVHVMRELLLSPAARLADPKPKDVPSGKLAQLRAVQAAGSSRKR